MRIRKLLKTVWFASAGEIARMGPFKTQADAVASVKLIDDHSCGKLFLPDTFVWPEKVEKGKK